MSLGLIITGITGLCGGAVVAAALSAFIIGLGIIPRYAGITHTGRHILLYEDFLVLGCILGNLVSVYSLKVPVARRLGIHKAAVLIIISIAAGKILGSLLQLCA